MERRCAGAVDGVGVARGEMGEDLLDEFGRLDARDDAQRATTHATVFDADVEDALEPLHPAHGRTTSCMGLAGGSMDGVRDDAVAVLEVRGKQRDEKPAGLWARLKLKVVMALWKLLWFLRVHGVEGFGRWFARKFSVMHAWRARVLERKARRLYRESRRRGRVFGGPRDRDGGDGRRRRSPVAK